MTSNNKIKTLLLCGTIACPLFIIVVLSGHCIGSINFKSEKIMTESIFKTWETSRKLYTEYFDKYSLEQLNKIPLGFNNNLIWNIGHIVVAQQSLIYRLSNLEMYITEDLFNLYKPGSRPTQNTSQEEVNTLRDFLFLLIEKTKTDFNDGRFVTFNERMTGTGFLLTTLQDAFEFNNYHEGMHLGIMMSLRKFV